MIRVAAIQMRSTAEKEKNLVQAQSLIERAAQKKAKIVALPEVFNGIVEKRREIFSIAESVNGPTVQLLKRLARKHRIWIHGGSILLKHSATQVTNTTLVFNPQGRQIARYDKIHLFDVTVSQDRSYLESRHVRHGRKIVSARIGAIRAGLSICYDLRFPELYRALSQKGANVLFVPAAFTVKTGKAHWKSLLRARAIENQCFVIAPAQVGTHYVGRKTFGHSMILGPWGEILTENSSSRPGVHFTDLKLDELHRLRKKMPVQKHRKIIVKGFDS